MAESKVLTEAERELLLLLKWALGGNRLGNPYCKDEVRRALAFVDRHFGSNAGETGTETCDRILGESEGDSNG